MYLCLLSLTAANLISVFALSDNCSNDKQAGRARGTWVLQFFKSLSAHCH